MTLPLCWYLELEPKWPGLTLPRWWLSHPLTFPGLEKCLCLEGQMSCPLPWTDRLDIWGAALCSSHSRKEAHPVSTGKGTPASRHQDQRLLAGYWGCKDTADRLSRLITGWHWGPERGRLSAIPLMPWERKPPGRERRGSLGSHAPGPGSCLWSSSQALKINPRATLINSGRGAQATHLGSLPREAGSPVALCPPGARPHVAKPAPPHWPQTLPGMSPAARAPGVRGGPQSSRGPTQGPTALRALLLALLARLTSALWKQLLLEGLSISLFLQEINTPHKVNGGFRQGAFTSSLSGLGLCLAPMTDPPTPADSQRAGRGGRRPR